MKWSSKAIRVVAVILCVALVVTMGLCIGLA